MYATLLLMSSTLGGDVTPTPGIVLASHSSGCVGTPAPPCCDSGKSRASFLDKIKARHALRKDGKGCSGAVNDCCTPAPAPVPAPAACCDPCAKKDRVGLLDKIRARTHGRKSSCCQPSCCADPCATAAPATPGTSTPPKEMPKPKDKPKDKPKGEDEVSNVPAIPVPAPLPTPAAGSAGTVSSGTPY